jgi:peptidoglycan-associated lipoprotein
MLSKITLAALAMCVPFGFGCAAKLDTNAAAMTPLEAAVVAARAPVADSSIETGGLRISDAIVRACNLHKAPAPPMFQFDSAALAEQDRTVLADVAKCFSDGPLRDHKVALTGRADPRGEGEYNLVLGESRADSVRRYLKAMGVAPQRVKATSRGELDAVGTNEEGWAQDRRVDIELASR